MSEPVDWWNFLLDCREKFETRTFTVQDVAEMKAIIQLKLKPTKKSSAKDRRYATAAGWISNFVRWGYVEKIGTRETAETVSVKPKNRAAYERKRWVTLYQLTEYGLERPQPQGRRPYIEED